MVLGLMVAGSSAKGYDDVTSEENVEAIEVLQAVGIMTGDDNGNFNPTQNVTRNEMAVIMSNLMDYRVATYKGTSPFTDVPEWAEPYVAACYTNGIIAGYSATTFGGSDPVVTSQATLMILKALGYFKYASDFGDDWQLATINQAGRIDLLEGVESAVRVPMTRNDVAQLVMNGLEAGTVEPDTSNKLDITVGDTQITSGTKYNFVTSGRDYAYAINRKLDTRNDGQYSAGAIVELGEKLYQGDLTKEGINDDLGRPATVWEFKTKEIGTYVDAADYEWSAKVTAKTLYNAVGKAATDNYDWEVYVDGVNFTDKLSTYSKGHGWMQLNDSKTNDDPCFLERTNVLTKGTHYGDGVANDDDKRTGNGVVTQVFVSSAMSDDSTLEEQRNGGTRTVTVAVTHYYAAEVYKINEDVKTIQISGFYGPVKSTDDFDTETKNFEDDQVVMYAYSDSAKSIQDVYPAEFMEGEVTQVRSGTTGGTEKDGDNFVVDSETYKYNATLLAKDRLLIENKGNPMAGYKDAFGYVAYIDESAVTYDYAYVLSMGTDRDTYGNNNQSSSIKGSTVYARLVLADGSIAKVQTNVKTSDAKNTTYDGGFTDAIDLHDAIAMYLNHIVSYSKGSDGVYSLSLKDVDHVGGKNIGGTGSIGAGIYPYAEHDNAKTIVTGTVPVDPSSDKNLKIDNGVGGFSFKYKDKNGGQHTEWYTANSNTTFIVAESDPDSYDDYTFSVYQGIKNVPDITNLSNTKIDVASNKAGIAKVVYIEDAEVSGMKNVVFIRADENAKIVGSVDNSNYYELNAYVDGKAETLRIKEGSSADSKLISSYDAFYNGSVALDLSSTKHIVAVSNVIVDADGLVTNVSLFKRYNPSTGDGVRVYDGDIDSVRDANAQIVASGTARQDKEVIYFGTKGQDPNADQEYYYGHSYNDDTAVAWYDYKGSFLDGSTISNIKKDVNDKALVVLSSNTLSGVCIQEIEDKTSGGSVDKDVGQKISSDDAQNATYLAECFKQYNTVTVTNKGEDAFGANRETARIPAGKTLRFEGDVETSAISFGTGSKLDVEGKLIIDSPISAAATITGKDAEVTTGAGTTAGTVTLTGDMKFVTNSVTMTVSGTTRVDSVSIKSGVSNSKIIVTGTMYVDGKNVKDTDPAVAGVEFEVLSVDSLHITGHVAADVKISTGNGSEYAKNGRVIIAGKMLGEFKDDNVHPATGENTTVQQIASLDGAAKVTMSAAAKLSTETFKPVVISLAAGATITLEKGTNEANITITDSNGNEIDTGSTETTIVIGVDTGDKTVATDGDVVADATEEEAKIPFTATATIIKDKASLESAVAAGYRLGPANEKDTLWGKWDTLDAHGKTTLPWLFAMLKVDETTNLWGQTITAVVKKDGAEVAREERTLTEEAVKPLIFHWDMNKDVHDNPNDRSEALNLETGELDGSYTVEFTWTVKDAAVEGQTPVVSNAVSYTEPTLISVQSFGGQDFTVDQKAGTIVINKVISLAEAREQELNLSQFSGYTTTDTLDTIKGDNDYAAIVFEVVNPDGVFSSLKHYGPTTQSAVSDSFNADGKTTFTIFVNAESKIDGTGVYKIEFVAKKGDTTDTRATYDFTVKYSSAALNQLKAIKDAYDEANPGD